MVGMHVGKLVKMIPKFFYNMNLIPPRSRALGVQSVEVMGTLNASSLQFMPSRVSGTDWTEVDISSSST